MKKILIGILCMCLLAALAVPAMAAGTLKLSVSDSSVHRGETFTVTVSVSGVDAYKRGGITVSYDSKFTLTKGEWLIDGAFFTEFDVSDKVGTFVFSEAKKLSGSVFKLTFKANSDAKFESGDISVKLTLGTSDAGTELKNTAKVTVSCDHKYGDWTKSSSTQHSRKCGTCGNTQKASHTYDHDCDTTCNDCGATRTTTHSFGTEWVSDESGHWHTCSNCQERSDFSAHVPGAPASEYTDQLCVECEFLMAPALGHTHKYDEAYLKDEAGHWQACTGCGEETEAVPHVFDGDCDTDCNTCGQERTVIHKEGESWETSSQAHWKVCTNCQTRLEQSDHIWGSGTVIEEAAYNQPGKMEYHCGVCNAKWVEGIPALTVFQAATWWMWLAAGGIGGVVVTVLLGLAIILPLSHRKNKGRFSH